MGAKSTNITSQQMLPLFQVISDLQKPYDSNLSVTTNLSNISLNKSILNNDDIIIHHPSNYDNLSSENVIQNRYVEHNFTNRMKVLPLAYGKCSDSGYSKRKYKSRSKRKYRKHSRSLHKMDEISFKFNGKHITEKQKTHKNNKTKNSHHKKRLPTKYTEATTNTDSSPLYHNRLPQKRIGLFTEMSLQAYKDDDIDISRHFKNITKEDFINTDTEPQTTVFEHSDGEPVYEVPKNVRNIISKDKTNTTLSDSLGKISSKIVCSSKGKLSSKQVIEKYEEMLNNLMERNQSKDITVQEKDVHIDKMKSKLKELLSVNNQFADENEYMKKQHNDMKTCIEQYKVLVNSLEECIASRNIEIDKCKGKCNNCNEKEVIAMKAEKQCMQLTEDLLMLKNVVYRLNVQLSRYQDKIREMKGANKEHQYNVEKTIIDDVDSVGTSKLPVIEEVEDVSIPPIPDFSQDSKIEKHNKATSDKKSQFVNQETYSIDEEIELAWGDVNSHTLGPLLNAYQESIIEKDKLIRDYECEFNRFTTKIKHLIDENNAMHDAVNKLAGELTDFKERCGLATTEKDALRKECEKLRDNTDVLTKKLTEIQAVYEQKVEILSRDYTHLHEEYFKCKNSLSSAEARCHVLEEQFMGLRDQDVIPSTIHQNRIDECKRLFDNLKVQYENEKERLNTRINLLQQSSEMNEKKIIDVMCEKQKIETKYKYSDHLIRKCNREIDVLKNELKLTKSARDTARKRAGQATMLCKQLNEQLYKYEQRHQATKVMNDKIKGTFKGLDEVEDVIKEKDRLIDNIKEEKEREILKLKNILTENMATIEAMRKHINNERLQRYGSLQHINTNNIPDRIPSSKYSQGKNVEITRPKSFTNLSSANLMPVKGGYFMHRAKHKSNA